ncbi:MAG: hypothetical protein RDA78_09625 [Roseibium sp.]|uniref:hypothetical protein n=1 Tax=Roseibium sp. TaxID=1936156 RepID=UPI003D9C0B21
MTARPSYKQRLAQKAERQRDYRQRLRARRRPSRADISITLFHWLTQRTARKGNWKVFDRMMNTVRDRLVARGFDKAETEQAIDALVKKIEGGWEFQRKPEFEDNE